MQYPEYSHHNLSRATQWHVNKSYFIIVLAKYGTKAYWNFYLAYFSFHL